MCVQQASSLKVSACSWTAIMWSFPPNCRSCQDKRRLSASGIVFFAQLGINGPFCSSSQRYAGRQSLPTHIFSRENLPLQKLDFSLNNLRRLPDGVFSGISENLEELYLGDNLFGDNLNPIFASPEFHNLASLKILDLSGNAIRGIEEGIFRGCANLQDLRLDRNSLTSLPSASLHGPHTLRTISLSNNRIFSIKASAFNAQPALERLRLDGNDMTAIEGEAFAGLNKLRELTLSRNKFARFNSDVFQGKHF